MTIKSISFWVLSVLALVTTRAAETVDRNDPHFVEAYLLIAEPGGALYSCVGHAALRMKCDAYRLDFCYSYESENIPSRVLTFLAGNLKMGMFAISTSDYLHMNARDHRGVRQYRINLPLDVKKRLCKVLDDRVKEGATLPYEYLEHGCAQSVLRSLKEALHPTALNYAPWPLKFYKSPRELFMVGSDDFPWSRLFITSVAGIAFDRLLPMDQRIIVPMDLLWTLQNASVGGQALITEPGVDLVKTSGANPKCWFTPLMAAILLSGGVIAAIHYPKMSFAVMTIYGLIAAFFGYLVFCSSLPATSWHWLVVPFNLLPLVFWRWRRYWAIPFSGVLAFWCLGTLLWPHWVMDPVLLIVVAAYAVFFGFQGKHRSLSKEKA